MLQPADSNFYVARNQSLKSEIANSGRFFFSMIRIHALGIYNVLKKSESRQSKAEIPIMRMNLIHNHKEPKKRAGISSTMRMNLTHSRSLSDSRSV